MKFSFFPESDVQLSKMLHLPLNLNLRLLHFEIFILTLRLLHFEIVIHPHYYSNPSPYIVNIRLISSEEHGHWRLGNQYFQIFLNSGDVCAASRRSHTKRSHFSPSRKYQYKTGFALCNVGFKDLIDR